MNFETMRQLLAILVILFHLSLTCSANYVLFNGIPAAFGDLDLNKRTDIVAIGGDGTRIDIHYQHRSVSQSQLFELGFSCTTDKPVVQVYLIDIDNDGSPNVLPLVLTDQQNGQKIYHLKSLKAGSLEQSSDPVPRKCEFTDFSIEMTAQPLLFDLDGDLRTDLMSLDKEGRVNVWRPAKIGTNSQQFEKLPHQEWASIDRKYFSEPHSNTFIDINRDKAADIVLCASGSVAYLFAKPDPSQSFKLDTKYIINLDRKDFDYGQSTFVDLDADDQIDQIFPRCNKHSHKCEIVSIRSGSTKPEVVFEFNNPNGKAGHSYDYQLESISIARHYEFPITIRASDLDGDGYTDLVIVVHDNKVSRNKVLYLHNALIQDKREIGLYNMKDRKFEVQEISFDYYHNQDIKLVTLFDINEDGKVDMLIGASEKNDKPSDLNVTAIMNSQMVDGHFMKVSVTNPIGGSATGPFICFELSQNDGQKMQGCAGQLAQSSYFALQPPYVIFGLGQTPHFVETLNVSIPGFGTDSRVRTRLLEQIVPDAQVIIIPRQKDNPNSWDYKMFLSPMSDLVFSTLIALAVLCLLILLIIFILNRQETLEDAAEHEEYRRHWPECR